MDQPRLSGWFHPSFYLVDAAAVKLQRQYFFALRLQFGLAIAATFASLLKIKYHSIVVSQVAAAVLILFQFGVLAYLRNTKLEEKWPDYRSVAEAIKSLSIRFQMAAQPFSAEMTPEHAAQDLNVRVRGLIEEKGIDLSRGIVAYNAIDFADSPIRSQPVGTRTKLYISQRLIDQKDWYLRKVVSNKSRDRRLVVPMFVFGLMGFLASLALAIMGKSLGVAGLSSSIVGALLALQAARQYPKDSSTFFAAANELSILEQSFDESDWEREVDEVESICSSEHSRWMRLRRR